MHHSEQHKYLIPMAKDMGVTLYQRFCEKDAAKFLQIQTDELVALRRKKQIGFLQVTHHQIEYFGVHLLEFLHSSSHTTSESTPHKKADVILRMPQVAQITGLSRTTLCDMREKGFFLPVLHWEVAVLVGTRVMSNSGYTPERNLNR